MSKYSWQAISPDDDYAKWIERTTENHKKVNEKVMTEEDYIGKEHDIKDIKYGLMVIDPTQEGEMMDILHFVGYWKEPTIVDATNLRKELMSDEEFGLTEIVHRLDILPAPDYIVQQFFKEISNE
jgi:hypothetical protein